MRATFTVLACVVMATLVVRIPSDRPPASPVGEAAAVSPAVPELPLQFMPQEAEQVGLRARLVLRDHGRKAGKSMYSLAVAIENASFSTMARVEFDPADLALELLDSKGRRIVPSLNDESAPAQMTYQVVIPGNCTMTVPAHDHGYGFAEAIWANDRTRWNTPPGEYQIRGTLTVTVTYGRPRLTGLRGDLVEAPDHWESEPQRLELTIPLSRFKLLANEQG